MLQQEWQCCIVCPSCFVAFQPLGSLCPSLSKELSPLELDNEAMDLNLEYLDDVSVLATPARMMILSLIGKAVMESWMLVLIQLVAIWLAVHSVSISHFHA